MADRLRMVPEKYATAVAESTLPCFAVQGDLALASLGVRKTNGTSGRGLPVVPHPKSSARVCEGARMLGLIAVAACRPASIGTAGSTRSEVLENHAANHSTYQPALKAGRPPILIPGRVAAANRRTFRMGCRAARRCDTPRCRNLASACSAGKCWTCAARRHERERLFNCRVRCLRCE